MCSFCYLGTAENARFFRRNSAMKLRIVCDTLMIFNQAHPPKWPFKPPLDAKRGGLEQDVLMFIPFEQSDTGWSRLVINYKLSYGVQMSFVLNFMVLASPWRWNIFFKILTGLRPRKVCGRGFLRMSRYILRSLPNLRRNGRTAKSVTKTPWPGLEKISVWCCGRRKMIEKVGR